MVSVTVGVLAYELSRSYLLDKRTELIRREALLNARFIDGALAEEPDAIASVLSDVSEQTRPVLIRSNGQWYGAVVAVGERDVPGSLRRVVDDGAAAVHLGRSADGPTVVVGVPLPRSGADFYQIFPLVELGGTLDAIRNSLVIAAMVTTVASAGLGLLTSRRIMRPLRQVAGAAERIADGDMATRLTDERDPDLVPLVRSFNEMADALDERIRRERRFAADVSHELRTPLSTLSAAVHVIERRSIDLSPSGRQAIDVLNDQVDEFTRVVLEILDLSRLESGLADVQTESVELRRFVAAVAAESDLADGVLHVDERLPARVAVDPRRLRVIVRNLLENAERYAGGCTALSVRLVPSGWAIDVDDDGPGISLEERVVLFERFRRGAASAAPDAPRGSGLGLALVAENSRILGATVEVGDAPHGGARFRVVLPLTDVTSLDPSTATRASLP